MAQRLKRISLLLPTRGRSARVQRFLESVRDTAADLDLLEIVICADDDDPCSHNIKFPPLLIKQIVVPRQNMGAYNAICLEASQGEITIAVNDDMIIRTHGWDTRIREMDADFPDGIYLGYGNDLFKGSKLCTFPIMSRRLAELMVNPYPRDYRGAFIDTHLMDVFMRLRKHGAERFIYLEDVIFEHVHFRVDANAIDQTYLDRPRFADDAVFTGLIPQRRWQAARLIGALETVDKLPDDSLPPETCREAPSVFVAPLFFGARYLLDFGLPFAWRVRLFWWMTARFYYALMFARERNAR